MNHESGMSEPDGELRGIAPLWTDRHLCVSPTLRHCASEKMCGVPIARALLLQETALISEVRAGLA